MVDTKLVKSAGEHWACSVLSRHHWAVALTRDGLERTDILAVSTRGSERSMIEVQVKTCSGTDDRRDGWFVGKNAQQAAQSDREWFVLVALPPEVELPPRSFVVPRDHLSAIAHLQHMEWLRAPGITEGRRKAGVESARVRIGLVSRYENRWDLLNASTREARVLLDSHYHDLAQREEFLPPEHPWSRCLPNW